MVESTEELKHDVVIKSRKRLEMNGVSDVTSYDEHEILVQINGCGASIDGDDLKIERFNAQNGELVVNGKINGLYYYVREQQKKKKGISSIFK